MHDLDRVQLEAGWPREDTETDMNGQLQEIFQEAELEASGWGDEYESGSDGEYEGSDWASELEYEYEEDEGPFDDETELEFAAELLSVGSDEELEQFIGKLFKKAARGLRSVMRGPLGRIVKSVAKRALPLAGGYFGGPVGSALGSFAGKALGLELEGLSPEDQELEVARQVVRLAGTAAQNASRAPATAPPTSAARAAFAQAARVHAPGLVGRGASGRGRTSGRWVRRGGRIVILGA